MDREQLALRAAKVLDILAPLTEQERSELMEMVSKHFCLRCGAVMHPDCRLCRISEEKQC